MRRINTSQDGDRTVVTGWGRTTNDEDAAAAQFSRKGVLSTKLRYAKVPVANDKCRNFNIDEKLQICAGGNDGMYTAMLTIKLYQKFKRLAKF